MSGPPQSGCPSAIRHDESCAGPAAAGDRGGLADGDLGTGSLPCFAVGAVAGKRSADHDDHARVGIGDDLVVGGVPAIPGLLGEPHAGVAVVGLALFRVG